MDRVQFIEHQGKRILLCDVTGCSPDEVMDVCDQVVMVVSTQPERSVLLLADFTGAQVNREAITRLKESAALDAPHIRRSAWIGVESFGDVWFKAVKTFSTRQIPTFKTRDEALNWLVAGKDKAAAS